MICLYGFVFVDDESQCREHALTSARHCIYYWIIKALECLCASLYDVNFEQKYLISDSYSHINDYPQLILNFITNNCQILLQMLQNKAWNRNRSCFLPRESICHQNMSSIQLSWRYKGTQLCKPNQLNRQNKITFCWVLSHIWKFAVKGSQMILRRGNLSAGWWDQILSVEYGYK